MESSGIQWNSIDSIDFYEFLLTSLDFHAICSIQFPLIYFEFYLLDSHLDFSGTL